MAKRIDFTLTAEQLSEIEQAINHSVHAEVRQRAIALRLLHLGQSPDQVAEAVMVTANTIYAWHKRWRTDGIVNAVADPPKQILLTSKGLKSYWRQIRGMLD